MSSTTAAALLATSAGAWESCSDTVCSASIRTWQSGQKCISETHQLDRNCSTLFQYPKIHIGMEIEGQESPLAGGRLIWPQRTRMTRNLEKGLLPPQKSSGTLLAAMATVWNGLLEAIKSEKSETKYKKKIAAFCSNLQQSQV
jgi:hypothetical protein